MGDKKGQRGFEVIIVTFKKVFSVKTIELRVDPYFTVTQFIENVRPTLSVYFNINENEIEIVESGQYELGMLSENAPALNPSNDQLHLRWSPNLNVSFYVRKKRLSIIS